MWEKLEQKFVFERSNKDNDFKPMVFGATDCC